MLPAPPVAPRPAAAPAEVHQESEEKKPMKEKEKETLLQVLMREHRSILSLGWAFKTLAEEVNTEDWAALPRIEVPDSAMTLAWLKTLMFAIAADLMEFNYKCLEPESMSSIETTVVTEGGKKVLALCLGTGSEARADWPKVCLPLAGKVDITRTSPSYLACIVKSGLGTEVPMWLSGKGREELCGGSVVPGWMVVKADNKKRHS